MTAALAAFPGRATALACLGLILLAAPASAGAPVRDADRTFAANVANYKALRERHVVMQRYDYTCGAASVATVARYFWGNGHTEEQVLDAVASVLTPDELADRVANGLAITDLRDAADELGYDTLVADLTPAELVDSEVPLVIPITVRGHDHFAVYRGYDGRFVYVADPLRGNVRTPLSEFLGQWRTKAALVIDDPSREEIPKVSPLSVTRREVFRGETNDQLIRGTLTRPATKVTPVRTGP